MEFFDALNGWQILDIVSFFSVLTSHAVTYWVYGSPDKMLENMELLIIPSGYVFSIWGLIYCVQGLFVIWTFFPDM
jgi:hypothetical protein